MEQTFISKLGGRRFLIAVVTLGVTTWLTYYGKLDGTLFMTINLGIAGALITGQTVDKFAPGRGKSTVDSPTSE